MQKIRKCIGAIALLLQISSFAVAQVNYPFRDTTLSHHERIKDLLSRLNVSFAGNISGYSSLGNR